MVDTKDENLGMAAIAALADKLRAAFKAQASLSQDAALVQQSQYVQALMIIAKFLKLTGAGDDVAGRIASLAGAIFDLHSGITHPVLQATAFANRSADRSDVWTLRGNAALGWECLIRAGLDNRSAEALVKKNKRGLGRLVRKGYELTGSIKYWHKTLKNRTAKNDVTVDSFHHGLALLDSMPGMPTESLMDMGRNLLSSAESKALAVLPVVRS